MQQTPLYTADTVVCRSGDFNVLNCLDKHPSQNHIVATGAYNGTLAVFDLRQSDVPITILEGHGSSSSKCLSYLLSPSTLSLPEPGSNHSLPLSHPLSSSSPSPFPPLPLFILPHSIPLSSSSSLFLSLLLSSLSLSLSLSLPHLPCLPSCLPPCLPACLPASPLSPSHLDILQCQWPVPIGLTITSHVYRSLWRIDRAQLCSGQSGTVLRSVASRI